MGRMALGLSLLLLTANLALLGSKRYSTQTVTDVFAKSSLSSANASISTIYVVFRPDDCTVALRGVEVWNKLQESGLANVRGLLVNAPKDGVIRDALLKSAHVRFPVSDAPAGRIGSALREIGYDHSLVAVLVDPIGRIRFALPWAAAEPGQLARLLEIIQTSVPK